MMQLNLQRSVCFIDLETTGVNIAVDRIVEVGILKVMPGMEKEFRNWRINPSIPIPEEASLIHGIYDKDVKDAPVFKEVAGEIFDMIGKSDIAGYNSNRFDVPLLIEEFLRIDMLFSLDDRKLIDVQRIFHRMEQRTLEAACQFYCNKKLINMHSAEADAKATFEVLLAQLERYDELENDMAFLHKFTMDEDFVDTGRRMIYKNGVEIFNFGKHKGQSVSAVLKKEPQYLDWILNNNFPLHTKQKLKEIWLREKNKID